MSDTLIVGIIGIVGTLAGAVAGAIAHGIITSKLERQRRENEDRVRYHQDRLSLYREFLVTLSKLEVAPTSEADHENIQMLDDHVRTHISLISSKPVADAAQRLFMAQFEYSSYQHKTRYPDTFGIERSEADQVALIRTIQECKHQFLEEARKELGVPIT